MIRYHENQLINPETLFYSQDWGIKCHKQLIFASFPTIPATQAPVDNTENEELQNYVSFEENV